MADPKEAIIIPRVQKFLARKKKQANISSPYLTSLIFFLFVGLFVLISFLPVATSLKILGLLIGSFILEDIFHFIKKTWQNNQPQ